MIELGKGIVLSTERTHVARYNAGQGNWDILFIGSRGLELVAGRDSRQDALEQLRKLSAEAALAARA